VPFVERHYVFTGNGVFMCKTLDPAAYFPRAARRAARPRLTTLRTSPRSEPTWGVGKASGSWGLVVVGVGLA
jgi:hypothetical protein